MQALASHSFFPIPTHHESTSEHNTPAISHHVCEDVHHRLPSYWAQQGDEKGIGRVLGR